MRRGRIMEQIMPQEIDENALAAKLIEE
jgi:hypothetical protein